MADIHPAMGTPVDPSMPNVAVYQARRDALLGRVNDRLGGIQPGDELGKKRVINDEVQATKNEIATRTSGHGAGRSVVDELKPAPAVGYPALSGLPVQTSPRLWPSPTRWPPAGWRLAGVSVFSSHVPGPVPGGGCRPDV
jgi:hypothetical protein